MHQPQSLLVDRSSTSINLPNEDVRAWAAGVRVFVSSIIDGMENERSVAAAAIAESGADPVLFERFGGRDDDATQAYLSEVASSHVYVAILGKRYGRMLPTRYSATHAEYLEAERCGLRISAWVDHDGKDRDGHQRAFIDEIRQFHVTGSYLSPAELASNLSSRLRRIATEESAPWCKLGRCVFRALRVAGSESELLVSARIRDSYMLSELQALGSPFLGGRPAGALFVSGGRCRPVRVEEVSTSVTSTQAADVQIRATILGIPSGASLGDLSTQGYSADDLTEIAIRRSWFGEANPLGGMGFLVEMPNPFAGLASLSLSEEITAPIAHLLATEALILAGRAERLPRFRLGPRTGGRRHLEAGWMPKQRFANQPPEERRVIGMVTA